MSKSSEKSIFNNKIILGSRASPLALAQTALAIEKLASFDHDLYVKKIVTSGDLITSKVNLDMQNNIENKDIFTKEIENALLNKEIDIAVHSCKDLSKKPPEGIENICALERSVINDVILQDKSNKSSNIICTNSPRRMAQALLFFQNHKIKAINGNINTRIRKLLSAEYDNLLLANCGILRLVDFYNKNKIKNLQFINNDDEDILNQLEKFEQLKIDFFTNLKKIEIQKLAVKDFLPAAGQGIIILQCRKDDTRIKQILAKINHQPSFFEMNCEMAFLQKINASCQSPIALNASINNNILRLNGEIYKFNNGKIIRHAHQFQKTISNIDDIKNAGYKLAEEMEKKFGDDIFQNINNIKEKILQNDYPY